MEITKGKLLSLAVVVIYVVVACLLGGAKVLPLMLSLLIPLAMIWFSEELGDYTGMGGYEYIGKSSPGWLIAAFGWFFLVGLPVAVWLLRTYGQ